MTVWNQFPPYFPLCSFCGQPVIIESSRTDGEGLAVHEECYLLKINVHDGALPPKDS
jgi:hypothetical protein